MKATKCKRYMRIGDGTTWPYAFEDHDDSVNWILRYGNPTKEHLLYAASVMSAYTYLFEITAKRRATIVRLMKELRKKEQYMSEKQNKRLGVVMSITFKELLHDHNISDVSTVQQHNMEDLLIRINKIRDAYGKPMIVTSGIRTEQDQLRIYRGKGIPDNKIPMNSGHLTGQCVDILDEDGALRKWVLDNLDLLQQVGLYCEDFRYCLGWVHFGANKPKSGHRIFVPFNSPPPHPELWDGKYDSKYDDKV